MGMFQAPSFSLSNRVSRAVWSVAYYILFRPSPRPFHSWRSLVLRLFGADIGARCHIYPRATIWAPWNLECGDDAAIADGAVIYNPAPIRLGRHAIVSQDAYLCGASHDYTLAHFPLISQRIELKAHSWVAARAIVGMGVTLEEGAILGLGSLTVKNLAAWTVYGGVPARPIGSRPRPTEFDSESA